MANHQPTNNPQRSLRDHVVRERLREVMRQQDANAAAVASQSTSPHYISDERSSSTSSPQSSSRFSSMAPKLKSAATPSQSPPLNPYGLVPRMAFFFSEISTHQPCEQCRDFAVILDLMIKGFLVGWEAVLAMHSPTCPVPAALARFAGMVAERPAKRTAAEQFAVLWSTFVTGALYAPPELGKVPSELVPAWIKPRPSQVRILHEIAIDFVIWPGLRERMVWDYGFGLPEALPFSLMESLRFYWPHELIHGFVFDSTLSRWELTSQLRCSLLDINHWRVTDHFLLAFPQYEDDVLPLSKLQEHIILWKAPHLLNEKDPSQEAPKRDPHLACR